MTEETNVPSEDTGAETTSATNAKVELPAIYGIKAGMTRIFDESGNHIPVTVVKLVPNHVSQVKTMDKDGYEAYQVAYYAKREKLINTPSKGHQKKAGLENTYARFAEIKVEGVSEDNLGKEVSMETFTPSMYVDVTGTSKGKGFQGVMKRYNFAGGPGAHGSKFHRTPGSIGNRATPGKVFKNKKMPGHMGSIKKTVQNLVVVENNLEKGYMLIKGSIPGSKNEFVRISKATKKS
jgi:large subunit ribosomal protein L3